MLKTALMTALALIAFAGNSVLNRLALGEDAVDAAGFTSIRLASGVLMLWAILAFRKLSDTSKKPLSRGRWFASLMLFVYALGFSYAYLSLDTGMGALILFGMVQITMITSGIIQGNTLNKTEWFGTLLAFAGFTYLMIPGASAPSFTGFLLMAFAGIAWGFYTLAGKRSSDALGDTAYNFLRTSPLVILLVVISLNDIQLTARGVILACVSGALTSGVGYALWYAALRNLSALQAAVLQLLVPVLATLGGLIFANESLSLRLILASALILTGIFLVIVGKTTFAQYIGRRKTHSDE